MTTSPKPRRLAYKYAVPATRLTRAVQTPLGVYTAGTLVLPLLQYRGKQLICLDNGYHPAGTCHAETVEPSAITAKE